MKLEITDISITLATFPGKIKAFANIELGEVLTIDGFKVIQGDEGFWVGNPSRKDQKTGKFFNTVYFVGATKEEPNSPGSKFRNYVSAKILEAYKAKAGGDDPGFDQTPIDDSDDVPF